MRVLIAVHHYPPHRVGGAELVAQRQAIRLAEEGIETRVVCVESVAVGKSPLRWEDEFLDGIPVRRLHLEHADPTAALCADFANNELEAHFRALILEWKPEIVHLISGYLVGSAPLNAAKSSDVPCIVTLTDFWFLCPTIQLLKGDGSLCEGPEPLECARCSYDRQRIFRTMDERVPHVTQFLLRTAEQNEWIASWTGLPRLLDALEERHKRLITALEEADVVLPVTKFLAEMYLTNGLSGKNFYVKPNGLELDSFVPPGRHASSDEIVFGYMGQLAPVKGIEILIRAFQSLQAKNPDRVMRLVIYGKWNAEKRYVEQIKGLARGNSAIDLAGEYENKRALELLSQMDVLVVPSTWYENAPLVIQEAIAARTPVIGTDVGGIAELVKNGETGLLFKRGDATSLAQMMQRFIDEPGLAETFRANMPAVRTYDDDVQELMEIYRGVLVERTRVTA